jgi:hypothetical protein
MFRLKLIIIVVSFVLINQAVQGNDKPKWSYTSDSEFNSKTISVNVKYWWGSFGQFYEIYNQFPYLGIEYECTVVTYSGGSKKVNDNNNDIMFYPPDDSIKNGYTWESGGYSFKTIDTNEEIIINKNLYSNCIHISFSNSITYAGEMWIKEGVGIVKWSFIRTNPPSTEVGYYLLNE